MVKSSPTAAGSNWAQLKKSLPTPSVDPKGKGKGKEVSNAQIKRKSRLAGLSQYVTQTNFERSTATPVAGPSSGVQIEIRAPADVIEGVVYLPAPVDKPLVHELRQMVSGKNHLTEAKRAPGNYIAIDCEMVGLGHLGSESALARISLVNYHGHVLLDTFVQPREKVTDWRTWVSGVTEADMVGAPEFESVQKEVAGLMEGRILVGHAIHNDLKALLLTHPNPLVRDTQKYGPLREKVKSKLPGLKRLVEVELGLQIQAGSHSSVTDARATMALYRLHKPEWEQILRRSTDAYLSKIGSSSLLKPKTSESNDKKRKHSLDLNGGGDDNGDDEEDTEERPKKSMKSFPGGGRKGVSSGLGVVVRRNGKRVETGRSGQEVGGGGVGGGLSSGGSNWWEESAS